MKDGYIKVAAATPELRVADPGYNVGKMIELLELASGYGVKILVYPELCITGYTSADLFFSSRLIKKAHEALWKFAAATRGRDILCFVGYPLLYFGKLYNTAVAVQNGRILSFTAKKNLPNYGAFSETRWFEAWNAPNTTLDGEIPLGSKIIHVSGEMAVSAEICEDLWVPSSPSIEHARAGANIICNLSASPETVGKEAFRRDLIRMHSAKIMSAYVYADAGDGESTTDLVFAGHNIIAEDGRVLNESLYTSGELTVSEVDVQKMNYERMRMTTFIQVHDPEYSYIPFSTDMEDTVLTRRISRTPFVPRDERDRYERSEKILNLQALGLKKRIEHTHAKRLVLGLSGGLDSTLALLVCVRAMDMLDRPHSDILTITMPCFGTTKRTKGNAEELAEALGTELETIDIKESVTQHFMDIGQDPMNTDVTFENAQARERTQILMDKANQVGGFVVGTGDLSELALGFATYNGDHMSMYSVNASVPKTLVRALVTHVASLGGPGADILMDIVATPVSPELLPSKGGSIAQVTEDIVGPYELHDFFLYYLVRYGASPKKVWRLARTAFAGEYSDETILKWLRTFTWRFFAQQYKRSSAPDGPKVGSVSFSPRGDWRMPSDASASAWMEELDQMAAEL